MKTIGIIAEYNPFHNGHAYQIRQIRSNNPDAYIVIAMSGDFVQRGTPALVEKHVRASMALTSGADLVLELPVSVSTGSAEYFASGAISLLDSLGVIDELSFGCESTNTDYFQQIAQILADEPAPYKKALQNHLKQGKSFPLARCQAMMEYLTSTPGVSNIQEILTQANNLLALEYYKALYRRKSSIQPAPLLRKGDAYHEDTIHEGTFASASAIRRNFLSLTDVDQPGLSQIVPEQTAKLLQEARTQNRFLTEADLDLLLWYKLLQTPSQDLTKYADVSQSLANRITQNLNQYHGFLPFTELLKTRDLTYTRVSRALLHILLGIQVIDHEITYARVLGFRKTSALLLKAIKNNTSIPLITKTSDAAKLLDPDTYKTFIQNIECSNIYESILAHKSKSPFIHEHKKTVVII